MEFQHSCSFCGWRRVTATPVMLTPSCRRCGCALDALPLVQVSLAAGAPLPTLPPWAALALRRLGVLVALLSLYAAAKMGYDSAGASGAMIAFGVGGFLLLPFVPERVGAGATRPF
jgi:hypothetical protein